MKEVYYDNKGSDNWIPYIWIRNEDKYDKKLIKSYPAEAYI